MAFTDHKLKFQIDADSTGAKRELNEVDGLIGRLGAGVSSLAGPAAIGAAGIAAIGAAAVSAGVALFNLTKQAADYGSTIFDASKKTGLAAETLSAMDFAAQQSGASLEEITGGVAKFAKTVGEAADGSDKAAAKLRDFGITPQEAISDLDAALGKVFKKIADAPPGIERMTLAQKAFGKSGADLLPFIDSFNGDLTELIQKAKELGVTIDDEAARAADEFGDQLDTLNAQFAGMGRTIATEFMPFFTEMAVSMSDFLKRNKDDIAAWATQSANFLRGLIEVYNDLHLGIASLEAGTHSLSGTMTGFVAQLARTDPILRGVVYLWERWAGAIDAVARKGAAAAPIVGFASGTISPALGGGGGGYRGGGGGGGGASSAAREAEKAQREAERQQKEYEAKVKKAAQDAIKDERQTMAERLALHTAEYERMYSVSLKYAADEKRTEEDLARYEEYLGEQTLEHKKDLLLEYIAFLKEAGPEAVDELRGAEHGLLILEKEIETNRNKNAANEHKRQQQALEDQTRLAEAREEDWREFIVLLREGAEEQAKIDAKNSRAAYESGTVMGGGGIGGAIGRGLGAELVPMFDEASNAMLSFQGRLAMVGEDINNFVGQSIGGLIDGLAAMGAAWLTTGQFSAQAALQMAASAALGIAIQAGVKAVFEFAEMAAAYARWDPVSAGMHKAAAIMYLKVAAVAGAIGVGVGLAGRAVGGGGSTSGGGGGSQYQAGRQNERDMTPISRVTDDAYISGRRTDPATLALARAVEKLDDKISGMKPGDVLVAGARQKRGFIGNQAADDVNGNAAIGVKLGRSMRLR